MLILVQIFDVFLYLFILVHICSGFHMRRDEHFTFPTGWMIIIVYDTLFISLCKSSFIVRIFNYYIYEYSLFLIHIPICYLI